MAHAGFFFSRTIFILRRRTSHECVVAAKGITRVLSDPKDQYCRLNNAGTVMYFVHIACRRPQASHSVGGAVGMHLLSADVKGTFRLDIVGTVFHLVINICSPTRYTKCFNE